MAYTINGQAQELAESVQQDGTTFVPLAGVIETLGGYVYWNNASKEATIQFDDKNYMVTAGDTNLLANGEVLSLSAAPILSDSHLYVPLDFFQTGLGCSVDVSGEDVTISRGA